ncbi:MAG: N-acetylneuraminate synthase family protein [Lachnospiraceae bacterium]|nr:N-acetylneuraminate synthase family protein [Lachnospiraceae bacterium]
MGSRIIERAVNGEFTLIAEIGVNYYDIAEKEGISNMEAAKLMIKKAAEAGVHAVKFQTYKAGTLAAKASPSYWDTTEEATTSQYELFSKFDSFGEPEYRELKEYSDECGTEFLSTAFDYPSADYLEPLMEVYKISSSDVTNLPFISHQAEKGKPVLLSVGASNYEEICRAVETVEKVNREPLVLLHCVLEYPTPLKDANLLRIESLRKNFPRCIIGYSDHTKPTENCDVIKTARNLGAVVVEKHFTLDKTLKGNDHYHAMDPEDVKRILESIKELELIRGNGALISLKSEEAARKNARRSVVSACFIPSGTVIEEKMLTFKRPGTGIDPAKVYDLIGKRTVKDIEEDTILTLDFFEEA